MRFRPPAAADSVLIRADATSLPAAAAILEWLPAGTKAAVWLEVPYVRYQLELRTAADATVRRLARDQDHRPPPAARRPPPAVKAIRTTEPPGTAPYAWLAGEAGTVRELRRHLVRERCGLDRRRVTFVGYRAVGSARNSSGTRPPGAA